MRLILLLISLPFFSAAYAQSKKELNVELRAKVLERIKINDSILKSQTVKDEKLKKARIVLQEDFLWVKNIQRKEQSIRGILQKNHTLLKNLGFNADSLLPMSEVNDLSPTPLTNVYASDENLLKKNFKLRSFYEMSNFSDEKLKRQNQMIQVTLDAYDSIIKRNIQLLKEEQDMIDHLSRIHSEYDAYTKRYQEFNSELADKSDLLAKTFFKVREAQFAAHMAEENKIYEEELKAAKKNNKKTKGDILAFVPPIAIEYNMEGDDVEKPVFIDRQDLYVYRESLPIPEMETPMEKEPVIFDIVEESAEFPGGQPALKEYLKKNVILPEIITKGELSGLVYLRFVVSEKGNISNVSVTRELSECKECDAEAVRVLMDMPNWIPGRNNGKAVNSWYHISIKFTAN